ncbi:MAG: M14 family metallopeptidase [Pseudomonadota bacterium]|nr:M14 family metallopeptidase [Pseudomonadota bacterium]
MTQTVTRIPLPAASPGTQRTLTVHRFGAPGARPRAYLHAALHADELPPLLVLHHLLRRLAAAEEAIRGEIVVVPVANPIGLDQQLNGRLLGRFAFDASGNFNRGFPDLAAAVAETVRPRLGNDTAANVAAIREALTAAAADLPRSGELEALRAILLGLSIDADLVLDLHCDSEALLHLYASRQHRDIALVLGRELAVAAVLLEDEPGGDPFDEANAAPWWRLRQRLNIDLPLACFATTVEFRGQAEVDDRLAERDAAALFRFLQRRGVIAGDPGPPPGGEPRVSPLEGVDVLTAPAAGLLAYRKGLGEVVQAGETVAELVDLTAEDPAAARTPIVSRTDGLVLARMAEKLVSPGRKFCKIAGGQSLAHRRAGKLLED